MTGRQDGFDEIFDANILIRESCKAKNFIGDGSQLTGIPSPDLSPYFKLDQTTPQTIINGQPILDSGLKIGITNSTDKIGFSSTFLSSRYLTTFKKGISNLWLFGLDTDGSALFNIYNSAGSFGQMKYNGTDIIFNEPVKASNLFYLDQTTPQTITATDTTITASDEIYFGDATDSFKIKKDTIQGILDLTPTPDLSGYFKLDQTTPQTITGGRPIFNSGLGTPTGNNFIWGDGTLTTATNNIIIGDGSVTMTSGGSNVIIGNGITKNGYTYGEIIIGNGAPSGGSNSASYGSRTLAGPHQFNNGNVIIGHTSNTTDPELKFFANTNTGSIKWWEDENYFQFGNFFIADNIKAMFGTARDASIYYDGTNFIINPKVVGSGYLSVLGDIDAGANTIRTTGDIKGVHKAADGTSAVADGTYTMGIGGTQNGTITIKDGIITAVQECVA